MNNVLSTSNGIQYKKLRDTNSFSKKKHFSIYGALANFKDFRQVRSRKERQNSSGPGWNLSQIFGTETKSRRKSELMGQNSFEVNWSVDSAQEFCISVGTLLIRDEFPETRQNTGLFRVTILTIPSSLNLNQPETKSWNKFQETNDVPDSGQTVEWSEKRLSWKHQFSGSRQFTLNLAGVFLLVWHNAGSPRQRWAVSKHLFVKKITYFSGQKKKFWQKTDLAVASVEERQKQKKHPRGDDHLPRQTVVVPLSWALFLSASSANV